LVGEGTTSTTLSVLRHISGLRFVGLRGRTSLRFVGLRCLRGLRPVPGLRPLRPCPASTSPTPSHDRPVRPRRARKDAARPPAKAFRSEGRSARSPRAKGICRRRAVRCRGGAPASAPNLRMLGGRAARCGVRPGSIGTARSPRRLPAHFDGQRLIELLLGAPAAQLSQSNGARLPRRSLRFPS
jgi:hypothetical protein